MVDAFINKVSNVSQVAKVSKGCPLEVAKRLIEVANVRKTV